MSGSPSPIDQQSPSRDTKSRVTLPATLAIGFTGHRKLTNEQELRAIILRFLKHWKTRTSAIVYGVSSVAAGSDLVFAECCAELSLPVRIFLPLPIGEFRDDFDEVSWNRAQQILDRALSVEVVGESGTRDERYYNCGIETVLQSQRLLAVWNGQPSRGLGGTADIVEFAKGQGRPVAWINCDTGEVQHFNQEDELPADPEMEFLNGLADLRVQTAINSTGDLARAWFRKIDDHASHAAPQTRRMTAIPIFCTAVAATLSGIGSVMGGNGIWLLGVGTGWGIMAPVLPTIMKLGKRQVEWGRIRTAAEICRSMLALWSTPGTYHVIGPEAAPELSGMLMSLNYLKISDRSREEISASDFKKRYRVERVQHQIGYFRSHAAESSKQAQRYARAIRIATSIALIANLWMFAILLHGKGPMKGPLGFVPKLTGTVFFQVATIAGALLMVYDYRRRRQRYREMHDLLVRWDRQLELSLTWFTILRITDAVEKALLTEVIEWRSLIRHRKLSQK